MDHVSIGSGVSRKGAKPGGSFDVTRLVGFVWVTWDIRMTIVSCWMLLFEATVRLLRFNNRWGYFLVGRLSDIISITKNS